MTYQETLTYINSLKNYERTGGDTDWGLERITELLERLGNPQKNLKAIHIAGTNGKGSTCAFIYYILKSAGYRVGLYTSPHLEDVRERIRASDDLIPKKDFARIVGQIKSAAKDGLSFFEVMTAAAFLYFKEQAVDFTILETGLGGRLDATNLCEPIVCVITPISLEHTAILGNTLTAIAKEKAGIIKKSQVIAAPQKQEVIKLLRDVCKKRGAEFIEAKPAAKDIELSLLGEHQKMNAGCALNAINILRGKGWTITEEAAAEGLRNTVWPGRLEILKRNPLIVLDGAQNRASAAALKNSILKLPRYARNFGVRKRITGNRKPETGIGKLILILAAANDKDISGLCKELNEITDEVIITKFQSSRSAPPEEISQHISKPSSIFKNSRTALKAAMQKAGAEDLILVTGSLYLVGEIRKLLRSDYASM